MALGYAALVLTPFLQKERLLLVRATDATRLCRGGAYEELPRHQAEVYLTRQPGRAPADLREFVARVRLTSLSLSLFDDRRLGELLRKSVRRADLVVVRECANSTTNSTQAQLPSLVQQRRLVRSIERETRATLPYEGRKYRLVADADLRRVPNRDSYEVVSRNEAMRVLDGLAGQATKSVADLIGEARGRLTQDWRPPMFPDGLILLRAIIYRSADLPQADRPMARRRPVAPKAEPDNEPPGQETVDVDQASQAQVLLDAAPDGLPFCEEDALLAHAMIPEEDVLHVDQARQAATLLDASRQAVPFCEECARAAEHG